MKQEYILSHNHERMYELIQSGFRPVFKTEGNQELRTYPFKKVEESREHFLSTARFMKIEFLDPESQSDLKSRLADFPFRGRSARISNTKKESSCL